MVFGQNVVVDSNDNENGTRGNGTMYKVDPLVVLRLYKDWVIPVTKAVEVEYLLRRLD